MALASPAIADAQPAAAPVATTSPAVDDATWDALVGRQVIVEMSGGTLSGELLRADGQSVVLVMGDGRVQSVPKANITGVRMATEPAPAPAPTPPPPNVTLLGLARAECDVVAGFTARNTNNNATIARLAG